MRKLLLATVFLLSCSKTQATEIENSAKQAGEKEAACVASQLLAGNTDPVAVGAACGGIAIGEVATIVEILLAPSPDGGAPPADLLAKATECKIRILAMNAPRKADGGGGE